MDLQKIRDGPSYTSKDNLDSNILIGYLLYKICEELFIGIIGHEIEFIKYDHWLIGVTLKSVSELVHCLVDGSNLA